MLAVVTGVARDKELKREESRRRLRLLLLLLLMLQSGRKRQRSFQNKTIVVAII